MKCCGDTVTIMQIRLAAKTYVLHRCSDCNRRTWLRDGGVVAFGDVSAAMSADAAAITKVRTGRQGKPAAQARARARRR